LSIGKEIVHRDIPQLFSKTFKNGIESFYDHNGIESFYDHNVTESFYDMGIVTTV
jgi:hypothetical protein